MLRAIKRMLDSQKYFYQLCSFCRCYIKELKQKEIELKIKDHMAFKYGGVDVEV